MADLSNFNSDGSLKWISKSNTTSSALPVNGQNDRIISGLVAVNVLTDVQSVSIKLIQNGNIITHWSISEIVSIDLNGNFVKVYSSDQLPLTLEFVSSAEAQSADSRFTTCLNGGVVA